MFLHATVNQRLTKIMNEVSKLGLDKFNDPEIRKAEADRLKRQVYSIILLDKQLKNSVKSLLEEIDKEWG